MSALMPTYKRLPVAFVRGEGAELWDHQGRRYLDGLCGIAVTNLGHCHPAVTRAIQEQAATLTHTSNLFRIPAQEQLAAELGAGAGMDAMFFCNSGSEANEAAIKLARRYGHERGIHLPTIIVLESAFHGRTLGSLAATAGHIMKDNFEPMIQGFERVPRNDLSSIEAVAARNPNIVAVLIEPVQGEGGVRQLDPTYLADVRKLCDANNWLLMFDEVQSGNGRCGALYAYQRIGVTPDVLTTAKGLGNGFPIGACMARGHAASVLGAGDHGTTYGGNPLACAAASAVINTLSGELLWERCDPIRERVLGAFNAGLKDPSVLVETRGLGLMIGLQVTTPTADMVKLGLEKGIVMNITAGDTIRLLPPLTMTNEQATELGQTVAEVVNETQDQAQENAQ